MNDQTQRSSPNLWVGTGAIGALLASSCCVAPLLFVSVGISGAWIGNLTALEPFKWVFIALAAMSLGLGFWHVYWRKAPPCEDGSYCAKPESALIVKSALWIATFLVAISATVDWWAPLFY